MKIGYTLTAAVDYDYPEAVHMDVFYQFISFCKYHNERSEMSYDVYKRTMRSITDPNVYNEIIIGIFVSIKIGEKPEEAQKIIDEVIEHWFPCLINGFPKEEEIEVPF